MQNKIISKKHKTKRYNTLILICTLIFLMQNCQEHSLLFNPLSENNNNTIPVPDTIEAEPSENDPRKCGLCSPEGKGEETVPILDPITIPEELPNFSDLSADMPPVRSQGIQGSCTAWATTYYLKSYHEKIQHGYDYTTYEHVMSPAFIYNQLVGGNCDAGSVIPRALELLKTQGVNTWSDFPYSDQECTNLPDATLLEKAAKNKIEDYFLTSVPEDNTDPNYTVINIMKALLVDKKPVIAGLDWKNLIFQEEDGETIARSFSTEPVIDCGHAVLIVGYDDDIKAFKFINSWGTEWGNEGYGWIDYAFYLPSDDTKFQEGSGGTCIVAFDKVD
ncbi:C1 family peptidase [Tenacibaculum xiamenense]|uniref:C1 family peptidase n=1 Tax=Tenacibaculum xiamenense TaxID=1261553 RepID=UPI00389400C7